jgi:hypothetical protein
MPINRIDRYRREHPEFLRVDPYLGFLSCECDPAAAQ